MKLTDDWAAPVLEKMNADLKPGNVKAAKLTGAMLLREFLMLRVAPLQACSCPLWTLGGEDDKLRLNSVALTDEELAAALRLLVEDDQDYPPSVFIPLFHRKDWEEFVASRPTFDVHGLVPPTPPGVPTAQKPVEVSSGESHGEGEEEVDSEETPEEVGETSPPSKA